MTRLTRWLLVLTLVALVGALLAGCGKSKAREAAAPDAGKTPAAKTLDVMVPCGQVGPFSEIAKIFEKQNPGVKLSWMPLNMVTIEDEILDGKEKPDVVLSMGDTELDRLAAKHLLVPGTRIQYADDALALTVPAKNPGGVNSFADLAKPTVKTIVVPDPVKNSVGAHGIEALKGAGLWDKVSKKVFVPQFAADSNEAAGKGQAEAAIGYYACVSEVHIKGAPPAQPKEIKVVGLVPTKDYKTFSCEGAVVKGCKDPEGGKKVLALLKTPEAQQIFKKWNFVRDLKEQPAAG